MLDASGLNHDQQNMVLTSISNNREFDKIASGLMEQHGDIHTKEGKRKAFLSKGIPGDEQGGNLHDDYHFAGKAAGKGEGRRKGKSKGKGKGEKSGKSGKGFWGDEEPLYDQGGAPTLPNAKSLAPSEGREHGAPLTPDGQGHLTSQATAKQAQADKCRTVAALEQLLGPHDKWRLIERPRNRNPDELPKEWPEMPSEPDFTVALEHRVKCTFCGFHNNHYLWRTCTRCGAPFDRSSIVEGQEVDRRKRGEGAWKPWGKYAGKEPPPALWPSPHGGGTS